MKKTLITIAIILVVLVAGFFILNAYIYNEKQADEPQENEISSYEECVAAGYPILETFPQKCMTPEGDTFTKSLSEEELRNMIVPVTVQGTFSCLPVKDPESPHNDICAFGLETEDGDFYGLRSVDESSDINVLGTISVGTEIEVRGAFTPGISLLYQGLGTIMVESVEVVDEPQLEELEV